jgi:uncharacterized protein (TIGR04551 family)
MTAARARVLPAALAILIAAAARPALAQYGGGMGGPGPGGMQPPPPMGQEPMEEGPAEEAPEEEGRPSDLEPLTEYAEQAKKKMQIFEVNGYLRVRSDYMHDFFLGQGYTGSLTDANGNAIVGLPPFPTPLECPTGAPMPKGPNYVAADDPGANCSHKNIGGANIRLRLEPTLNVTDQVRVHALIDVLDNTLLGSTPDSLAGIPGYNRAPVQATAGNMVSPTALPGVAPASYLYTSMDPPTVGINGFFNSIVAKRAWGEVDGEFGRLSFGRMPWNWGRGIRFNDGSCPDCDLGTNVDRVMASTQLYGHQIAAAWDLGAQGYTIPQLSLGRDGGQGAYPYDLSQDDDVLEFMAYILKMDAPVPLRERIDRGDVVLNYGVQLVYRNQGNQAIAMDATPQANGANVLYGPQPLTREQIQRAIHLDALIFQPDIWAKLYYKALTIEVEAVGVFGRVLHPQPLTVDDHELTIANVGWVAAAEMRLYKDSFFVGLETGGATGDQAEDPSQYLNYRWHWVQQPLGDHALHDFHFSPEYHVDEIFWRHIEGTVTNAIYIKPSGSYWFDLGNTRAVGLWGSVIYSLAPVPVSTPGNSISYGVEADLGATYRNTAEGFYTGIIWGIFFPMAALDRNAALWPAEPMDASSAQILRIFFGIRF